MRKIILAKNAGLRPMFFIPVGGEATRRHWHSHEHLPFFPFVFNKTAQRLKNRPVF